MVKYEMTGLKQYKTNFLIFKEIEDHNSGTILNLIKVYLLTCSLLFCRCMGDLTMLPA